MLRRVAVGVLLAGWLGAACSDGAASDRATPTTAAPDRSIELAGELGPGGGVVADGVELQSTPESLYPYQTDGPTAVGPFEGVAAGLSVVRDGGHLCVGLHGLPIGGHLLAETCDLPAYETHDDVNDIGHAYISNVNVDGRDTRIAWAMTYLDAATVDFGPGSSSQTPEAHLPFWMHRFFALVAPAGATELRVLASDGRELDDLPLETPT